MINSYGEEYPSRQSASGSGDKDDADDNEDRRLLKLPLRKAEKTCHNQRGTFLQVLAMEGGAGRPQEEAVTDRSRAQTLDSDGMQWFRNQT